MDKDGFMHLEDLGFALRKELRHPIPWNMQNIMDIFKLDKKQRCIALGRRPVRRCALFSLALQAEGFAGPAPTLGSGLAGMCVTTRPRCCTIARTSATLRALRDMVLYPVEAINTKLADHMFTLQMCLAPVTTMSPASVPIALLKSRWASGWPSVLDSKLRVTA